MIKRLASRDLRTTFGTFTEILYYDGQSESIALVMGEVSGKNDVLCRVHSNCISAHVFNSIECSCREEMESAQKLIQNEGRGVIIWLDQEGKGSGHLALMQSIAFKKEFGQAEAYVRAGYKADARSYIPAVQILSELNVRSIVLLTNATSKAAEIEREGVPVSAIQPMQIDQP
ncbi:MAG: GTP cyclohydrolase [Pyrinomonadaceae bacterium]